MENLVKKLKEMGVSKYEISKKCGVTWATVQSWYVGKTTPKQSNILNLERLIEDKKSC